MSQSILLESGTNEMELLVFRLDTTFFGINVAKVREIMQRTKTISIPNAPPVVEGSFKLREEVLTLVNLGRFLKMEGEETKKGEGLTILVEFNNIKCGILVDAVEMIHRLQWNEIEAPSPFLLSMSAPITGTVNVNNKTVLIPDFETIVGEILGIKIGSKDIVVSEEKNHLSKKRILYADDSQTLRDGVTRVLQKGGFKNITVCSDGQMAWDTLESKRSNMDLQFDIVLSDIEMPRMDGLHLTKRIKEDPDFKSIPVILFSSLITDDNIKKCIAVGADDQVSKPDSQEMLDKVIISLKKYDKL